MKREIRFTYLAPLLLLFALLASGCSRVAETRFLNFDAESSAGALISGWSGFEKTPQNDTFVWSQSRQAKISIVSRGDGDRLIRFRCWAFVYPRAVGQSVTLFLNDARVESVPIAGDARVYTMIAPAAVFRKGPNEIRFEFASAEAPKDRLPGSTDDRTLSAAFDWLEIVPPLPVVPEKKT